MSGKFIDTKALFEYGYNNYTLRRLRERNAIASQIEIGNGTNETKNLDLLISDDITALISQNDLNTEFYPEIEVVDNLFAPISQGSIVGKIKYNIDGIEYSSNLIASHSVEKSSFVTLLVQSLLIFLILLQRCFRR